MINDLKKNKLTIIVSIILLISTMFMIYKFTGKAKESEKIDFFISAVSLDNTYLEEKSKQVLASSYKEVNIVYTNENNSYYEAMLQANGLVDGDILIVNANLFDNLQASTAFAPFDDSFFLSNDLNKDDFQYLSVEGVIYGIICKDQDFNLFNEYITFLNADDSYVICMNKSSTKLEDIKKVIANILK